MSDNHGSIAERARVALRRISIRRLRSIHLPDGLLLRVIKQYFVAGMIAVFSCCLSIVARDARFLYGMAFAVLLVAYAVSNTVNYDDGKILELPMQCVSSTMILDRKSVRVVFCTVDDSPQYFEFYVPGKRATDFIADALYVVYFNPDKPKELLGSTQL